MSSLNETESVEVTPNSVLIKLRILPFDLNGEKYLTISQFARAIGKSAQSVYHLISDRGGTVLPRVKAVQRLGKLLIPVSELIRIRGLPQKYGVN